VRDALTVLAAFEQSTGEADTSTALGLLALVAGQDVEQDEDGTWKIARKVAPDRVISTVDPEARHMHKSVSEYRDGYKAHIAIEPETGLVTAAALTPANAPDGKTGVTLLAGEEPGLQILGDGAYGSGETLAALGQAGHHRVIKPWPIPTAIAGGFNRDDFVVDTPAGTVTCPAGHTVTITPRRAAVFGVRCRGCPLRERCTRARDGRTFHLTPHDIELVESRRGWRDGDFAEDYRRWRPMAERSIAWLVAHGNRRVRFRGVERNQLGLSLRIAAINLRRLVNLGLVNDRGWRLKAG
jgi:IS5 family transposase